MCAVAINTEVNTENNLQLESFTPFFLKASGKFGSASIMLMISEN